MIGTREIIERALRGSIPAPFKGSRTLVWLGETRPVLFNSLPFVGFLLIVLFLYYLPPFRRAQTTILILASLYFYAAKDHKLLLLLLTSIFMNSILSALAAAGEAKQRKNWITLGIVLNLGLLALFKYGRLLAATFFLPGERVHTLLASIPLPIGISFFTFEGISILVDCWRKPELASLERKSHVHKVSLLIAFFPHLVAGPILKAQEFFPQIGPKRLADVDWNYSFRSLTVGYFLKMVVADNLKEQTFWMTFPFFKTVSSVNLMAMLFGYSMQIFADFAGYSLIALGLAALFGYRLADNFRFPYLSASFSEFWTRWHISLSSFLREYLYVPLGGNRRGKVRTYVNLMIVMGLGGLWHGAAWSYAVWGLVHGLALAVERWASQWIHLPQTNFWRIFKIAGVFCFVTLAWLLFRLPDFSQAVDFLSAIGHNWGVRIDFLAVWALTLYSLPVVVYHLAYLHRPLFIEKNIHLAYGLMLFLIVTNSGPGADFIYFQF